MGIKKYLLMIFLLVVVVFAFAGCVKDKEIELRVTDECVQWSYVGEDEWTDVIDVNSIKQLLGETYKGDTGERGQQGIAGKQVEFRTNGEYIQWHYVGENNWNNLIAILELKSDLLFDTNPQQLAFYPLDDGTYGVGAGNATQLSSITIPETYLGKRITKIVDRGFENCKLLKTIVLPNSILSVGEKAFSGCELLEEINISDSITDIGYCAFYGCNSLNSKSTIQICMYSTHELYFIAHDVFVDIKGDIKFSENNVDWEKYGGEYEYESRSYVGIGMSKTPLASFSLNPWAIGYNELAS